MSSILVGIIGNTAARFHEFTASAVKMAHQLSGAGHKVEFLIGGDWCGARNTLAQMCLDEGHSHLWFMDDDHSFPPTLLANLHAWDVDLVTPMCLTRVFPFAPVSYVEAPPGSPADFMPIDLADCPSSGLVKLVAGGAAGMLIKREVLEATRYGMSWDEAGGTRTEGKWFEYGDRSEDIIFCEKAIAAGFTLYGDLGARLGHITTAIVVPKWDAENGWTTLLRIGNEYEIVLKNAYDMVGRNEIEVEVEEVSVEQAPDPWRERQVDNPMTEPPEDEPPSVPEPQLEQALHRALAEEEAERIEIWQAEDAQGRVVWWWRAIDADGVVLAKDYAHREVDVIAAAFARFPECSAADGEIKVFQIARELDDSRNIQQFGPPRRLWNREPE